MSRPVSLDHKLQRDRQHAGPKKAVWALEGEIFPFEKLLCSYRHDERSSQQVSIAECGTTYPGSNARLKLREKAWKAMRRPAQY